MNLARRPLGAGCRIGFGLCKPKWVPPAHQATAQGEPVPGLVSSKMRGSIRSRTGASIQLRKGGWLPGGVAWSADYQELDLSARGDSIATKVLKKGASTLWLLQRTETLEDRQSLFHRRFRRFGVPTLLFEAR